jgi:hypothetical protein
VNQRLVREVRRRAGDRCEYCRIPFPQYRLPFQVDHVIARQHEGSSELGNLALACFHCNRHKGPNIAGIDPVTGDVVRLFHPRTDVWDDHFRLDGPLLVGSTAAGRATVQVLAMNDSEFVKVREALIAEGAYSTS